MLSVLHFLAQAPAPDAQQSPLGNPVIMMVVMGVLFYFLLIRPQQRQRKELEKRVSELQKGDQVVTTAGIHGLVHNIKERTVVLKVAEATFIEFDKNAVSTVLKKDTTAAVESK